MAIRIRVSADNEKMIISAHRLLLHALLVTAVAVADATWCSDEQRCTCTGVAIDCATADLDGLPAPWDLHGAHIVNLSGNAIDEIDAIDWRGVEQLQYLYLNRNSIYYIRAHAFDALVNLEHVDLANNYLDGVPERLFASHHRMRTLILQGNLFERRTPALHSTTLEELDMSFCKLHTFTAAHIEHLPALRSLNLQVNNLRFLAPEIFAGHVGIRLVLAYNQWGCNCSTVALYRWALQQESRVIIDEKCNTRHNMPVNLFNRTREFLYKERCEIDEETFALAPMKNLSLTKVDGGTTVLPSVPPTELPTEDGEGGDVLLENAWLVFFALALGIVLLAIAVGVLVGYFIGRTMTRHHHQQRQRQQSEPMLV